MGTRGGGGRKEENRGLTRVLLHSTCYQVKGNRTSQDSRVRGSQISVTSTAILVLRSSATGADLHGRALKSLSLSSSPRGE